ncbi:MAG TPA: hypothetical protein VGH97_14770 [Thermoanaerobaculia bacterium]
MAPTKPSTSPTAAGFVLLGGVCSFLASAAAIRAIRADLLLDAEPTWALPRFFLSLAVIVVGVAAGGLAVAAAHRLVPRVGPGLPGLPLSDGALAVLAAVSVLAGSLARLASLSEIPWPMWVDDVSLLEPTLALRRAWSDFLPPVRAVPYVPGPAGGTVGVLYLELYRVGLDVWGTTVFGVRFPSLLGGIASLLTAAWLGRRLLPRGGGALVALILAGLRWHLIESRWGWNTIVLAPVLDVAAILLLRAMRRRSLAAALAAGAVAGIATHVYLAAWIGAAGLGLLALWPVAGAGGIVERAKRSALYAAGFAAVAGPLLLRPASHPEWPRYFARAHPFAYARSLDGARALVPALVTAADGMMAPWLPDPLPRHDIPGRARLPWIVAIPAAAAYVRALLYPRDRLSAFLLAHASTALAGALAWGPRGHPNGFRYGYLTTILAVGAGAGVLWLLAWVADPRRRRLAAVSALGLLAIGGALGIRDTLAVWGTSRATFDGFLGQDTLIARTALRWESLGDVSIEREPGAAPPVVSRVTVDAVRKYDVVASPRSDGAQRHNLRVRIAGPAAAARSGERAVERVVDGWGRAWGVVYAAAGDR